MYLYLCRTPCAPKWTNNCWKLELRRWIAWIRSVYFNRSWKTANRFRLASICPRFVNSYPPFSTRKHYGLCCVVVEKLDPHHRALQCYKILPPWKLFCLTRIATSKCARRDLFARTDDPIQRIIENEWHFVLFQTFHFGRRMPIPAFRVWCYTKFRLSGIR